MNGARGCLWCEMPVPRRVNGIHAPLMYCSKRCADRYRDAPAFIAAATPEYAAGEVDRLVKALGIRQALTVLHRSALRKGVVSDD